MVAGESVATDTNRCRLKPLRRSDYYPIAFSDDQWQRLEKAFPSGVCDWTQLGVDQTGAVPWRTYQDAAGNVIYGGKALGAAPRSQPLGTRATTRVRKHRKTRSRRHVRRHSHR